MAPQTVILVSKFNLEVNYSFESVIFTLQKEFCIVLLPG